MNLIEFTEQFPDEASCRAKFKAYRDKEGVVCRKCGHTEHYWLKTIEKYQCKKCKTRTSLRSGTVMHASNLPFRYWFIAIHLLTSTKKTFSALELQRQIGHKFYEPIWDMLNKLRATMGIRDNQYQLDDVVEVDEGFFSSVDTEEDDKNEKDEKNKRGRGSNKKSTVMVLAKTVYDGKPKKKHQKVSKFRYVKMIVMENLKGSSVDEVISANVSPDSVIKSDSYSSYSNLKNLVDCHVKRVVNPKDANKYLPWVHTMIANAKRTLLGIHHMVSEKHIQGYLDEFCYKVNRRYFGDQLFDRLLIASVSINYKNFITDTR